MSETTNTENLVTEEISAEYLASIRLRLRRSSNVLDEEIKDLIRAARDDLVLGGVLPIRAKDESDALIKQAIATYVKAEFGLDNEDSEKYRDSYHKQKVALALASDYIDSAEEV